jgi:molybdopterin/thiamine biosynthesis adenylyltransferase/rhodanese-related sulfurtransferase
MNARERVDARVAALRRSVPEVEVEACAGLLARGARLLDVREPDEVALGSPVGALRLSRAFLEQRIGEVAPEVEPPLLVLCGSGTRSLFVAEALRALGYDDVRSVRGGLARWREAGLPLEVPRTLDTLDRARYERHLRLPEVGEAGQLSLLGSRVLVVGVGGLGSPAALYLAAAGVGTLDLVDFDVVDRSNLQRQVLHTEARIGHLKVNSARETLTALNPRVRVNAHATRLDAANVDALVARADVVVDGTDNFSTRYLVNDACVRAGKPNVHGSVFRFEGQVSVFWPGRPGAPGPCYRCLFPAAPPPELAPSCAEAGVLGVLPGVIGLLEAVETLKLLLGLGSPLVGRVLHYDALDATCRTLTVPRAQGCPGCGSLAEVAKL